MSAWFRSPIQPAASPRALFCAGGDTPVVVSPDGKKIGAMTAGGDRLVVVSALDKLMPGWHHLAVQAGDQKTAYYIDGGHINSVALFDELMSSCCRCSPRCGSFPVRTTRFYHWKWL